MGAEKVLVDFAKKEVGYRETPTNITKYNQWADENDYWFTRVQGCAWCTSFVAYCIEKSLKGYEWCLEDFCLDNNCCWSDKWMNNFKVKGRFHNTPAVGDLAFTKGHVGIVSKVDSNGTLLTIEGNVNDSVDEFRRYNAEWLGFGRPMWEKIVRWPEVEPEDAQAKTFVINQGIYIGREDGEMHWEDNLTRGEMTLILYRYWKKFNK